MVYSAHFNFQIKLKTAKYKANYHLEAIYIKIIIFNRRNTKNVLKKMIINNKKTMIFCFQTTNAIFAMLSP